MPRYLPPREVLDTPMTRNSKQNSFSVGTGQISYTSPTMSLLISDQRNVSLADSRFGSLPIDYSSFLGNLTPSVLGPNNRNITFSLGNASHIEEYYEAKLHPEECLFQEVLKQFLVNDESTKTVSGQRLVDRSAQADIANSYASFIDARRTAALEEQRQASEEAAMLLPGGTQLIAADRHSTLHIKDKDIAEFRAERDLWSLLEALTRGDLLCDLEESAEDESLRSKISALDHGSENIPEVVETAFGADRRLKKGRILVDWLEACAADQVREIPLTHDAPWGHTLNALLDRGTTRGRKTSDQSHLVSSLHPDAQLGADGLLLLLEGDDCYDQEQLLHHIWLLVRSGRIQRAQEVAVEHRLFWLAGSISGLQDYFYEETPIHSGGDADVGMDFGRELEEGENGNDRVNMIYRGNAHRPQWLTTCWKYAESISKNPANFMARAQSLQFVKKESSVPTLEMTIYAALANNLQLLLQSTLLPHWSDKLWAVIKCTHERDLLEVLNFHKRERSACSKYFIGCDDDSLQTEQEFLAQINSQLGSISLATCIDVFNKLPPLQLKTVEDWLLKLQSSIIKGKSGLRNHIEKDVVPLLEGISHRPHASNSLSRLLRVYCHLFVWLKYSAKESNDISDVVTDVELQLAVKCYVDHLVTNKQRTLVAPYLCFVSQAVRISTYADILIALTTTSMISAEEAAPLIQLAKLFFPRDLPAVLQTVVEVARNPRTDIYLAQGTVNKAHIFRTDQNALVEQGQSDQIAGTNHFALPEQPSTKLRTPATVRFSLGGFEQDRDDSTTTPFSARSTAMLSTTPVTATDPADYSLAKRFRGGVFTPVSQAVTISETASLKKSSTRTALKPPAMSKFAHLDVDHHQALATMNWINEFTAFTDDILHVDAPQADQMQPRGHAERLRMTQLVGSEDTCRLNCLTWKWFSVAQLRELLAADAGNAMTIKSLQLAGPDLDAIRQSNRLLNAFYRESAGKKLLQAKFVFHKFCPPLASCVNRAVSELDNMMISIDASSGSISGEQERAEKLWLAKLSLRSELGLLTFWTSYVAAMEAMSKFQQQLKEFQAMRNRILGNEDVIRSSLARIGDIVEKSARTTLDTLDGSLKAPNNFSGGITHVWKGLQRVSVRQVVHVLKTTALDVASNSTASHVATFTTNDLAVQQQVLQRNTDDLLEFLLSIETDEQCQLLFDVTGDESDVEAPVSEEELSVGSSLQSFTSSVARKVRQLKSDCTGNFASSQWVLEAVAAIKSLLIDLQTANHVAAMVTHQLLGSYLQVCFDVTSTLGNIHGANSPKVDPWNRKAIELANTIASSQPSLQLYKVLRRRDLENILQQINEAALRNLSSGESFLLRGE